MFKNIDFKSPIIIIILLACFLRVFLINQVPPSLNWDEVSLGYNAYSILKTGRDEWGKVLPLTFEAFGDYKLPGYIYTLVPFVAIFGLNELSVKLPSIVAGIISVYLIFLIVKKLNPNNNLALVASILLAISPWHIFLSRIALEANLALMFFLAAIYFFIQGLPKYKYFYLSGLFLSLAVFTYNSARVFLPLFLVGLFFVYKRELLSQGKKLLPALFLLFIFFGLALYIGISQDSSSRYFWVKIIDTGAINYLDQARVHSSLPKTLNYLIYNRYVYFITTFIQNYLKHFSPDFLFFQGGSNYQFSIPKTGLLYLIELPFLLVGVFIALKSKFFKIFLLAILLAPIPAAITRDSPHTLRAIFMLGSLQVLVALGLVEFVTIVKQFRIGSKLTYIFLIIILGFSSAIYMNKYLFVYPKEYSESWQYGYKQVVLFLQDNFLNTNEKIYFSKKYGEPHIFYLFYTRYNPSNYQNNPALIRYADSNWRWVDRLDNIYFINDWEVKEKLRDIHSGILITAPGNYPKGRSILFEQKLLDGKGAFDVVKL